MSFAIAQALDQRPVIVAIAGPNGAGKSTFYRAYLAKMGLPLVNADVIAVERRVDAYRAAAIAEEIRVQLTAERKSFVFETVFSDPVGDKLQFLHKTAQTGYNVVLLFVGVASTQTSEERVAIRASKGGHDVPTQKLQERYPRTMANLRAAIPLLPKVFIYDNDDLNRPHRLVAVYAAGKSLALHPPVPAWLAPLLPPAP